MKRRERMFYEIILLYLIRRCCVNFVLAQAVRCGPWMLRLHRRPVNIGVALAVQTCVRKKKVKKKKIDLPSIQLFAAIRVQVRLQSPLWRILYYHCDSCSNMCSLIIDLFIIPAKVNLVYYFPFYKHFVVFNSFSIAAPILSAVYTTLNLRRLALKISIIKTEYPIVSRRLCQFPSSVALTFPR